MIGSTLAARPMKTLGYAYVEALLKQMADLLENFRLFYKSLGVLNVPTLSVILDDFFKLISKTGRAYRKNAEF